MSPSPVRQLRVCVTATDHTEAVRFYRDVLGMPEQATYTTPDAIGRVTILAAGAATLELADQVYAAYIDEVEVGRRVAGPIRIAIEVDDSTAVTEAATVAGADLLAPPTRTPWNSVNARVAGPAGLQLTIFHELGEG